MSCNELNTITTDGTFFQLAFLFFPCSVPLSNILALSDSIKQCTVYCRNGQYIISIWVHHMLQYNKASLPHAALRIRKRSVHTVITQLSINQALVERWGPWSVKLLLHIPSSALPIQGSVHALPIATVTLSLSSIPAILPLSQPSTRPTFPTPHFHAIFQFLFPMLLSLLST